jgi:hypothetical protein
MKCGLVRDFFAIGAQTIALRLPELKNTTTAKLLVAGKPIPITRKGSAITLEVPGIVDHEVVAIDR